MFEILEKEIVSRIKYDENLLADLEQCVRVINISKGEYLLRNTEVCQHGYFITKGSFMHTHLNDEGKEFVIAFHVDEVYRYITSPQSFFSGKTSEFEIVALEESQVLAFHKNDLEELSSSYPHFHQYSHNLTSDVFLYLYKFSTMKLSTSSKNFIEKLYKDYPVFFERIPDKYIARFMGISVEWFCKLKKKLHVAS